MTKDSNYRPLLSEATSLLTEPQPVLKLGQLFIPTSGHSGGGVGQFTDLRFSFIPKFQKSRRQNLLKFSPNFNVYKISDSIPVEKTSK